MTDSHRHSIESEQALLGCLLFDNECFERCAELRLEPEHWLEPLHQRLYAAVKELVNKGRLADPVILVERFKNDPAFNDLGGVRYFADLVDRAPPTSNAGEYAKAIINGWQLRTLNHAAKALERSTDAESALSGMRAALDYVDACTPSDDGLEKSDDVAKAFFDKMDDMAKNQKSLGLSTGLKSFDEKTGGLVPGDLIVIGGASSMGKSTTGRGLLCRAASKNPVNTFAFYSLEMPKWQVMARTISEIAYKGGVKLPYMLYRQPSVKMTEDLAPFRNKVPANLFIADKSALTVEQVIASVKKLKRKYPRLAAIVIDHLHEMARDSTLRDPLGDVCGKLKALAKECDITIILLAQLNRAFSSRDNKRPNISDLKESGSIEQKADVVIFPWREYQILKDEKPRKEMEVLDWEHKLSVLKNQMLMIYAKVRMGQVGDVEMWCNMAYDTFDDKRDW